MKNRTQGKYIELFWVMVFGVFFYSAHFYSYLNEFSSAIFFFSDPDDAKVYAWNAWHLAHQIKQGINPFFTNYICTPEGVSLWMHAYTPWFGILNLAFSNVALSINLGIAIQLVAAFVGFYYLALYFGIKKMLGVFVAYVAVFNTYVLTKAGVHYNLILIGLLPFILLFFLRGIKSEHGFAVKKGYLWLCLALLMIGFFMDYYVVFYGLAFMLTYFLWFGIFNQWFSSWNWKKGLVLSGVLLLGHIGIRLLRIGGFAEKGAIWAAADLRALINQSYTSRYFKDIRFLEFPNAINDNNIFLGYGFVLIFIICLALFLKTYKNDKWLRFFLFGTVLLTIVTLPVLRISGKDLWYNITAIVHFVPFVNNVRSPDRFILLVFVFGVLFVAGVLHLKLVSINKQLNSISVIGFLLILFYSEHAQQDMRPIPLSASEHNGLEILKDQNVLMLPFGIRDGYEEFGEFDEDHLLLQIQHGFKMPSGYLSRHSEHTWDYYRDNSFFQSLVALQKGEQTNEDWYKGLQMEKINYIYASKKYLNDHPVLASYLERLPISTQTVGEGKLYHFGLDSF